MNWQRGAIIHLQRFHFIIACILVGIHAILVDDSFEVTRWKEREGIPEKVILTSGGMKIAEAMPEATPLNSDRAMVELSVPSSAKGELVLKIVRNKEERTMAIDEIEGN